LGGLPFDSPSRSRKLNGEQAGLDDDSDGDSPATSQDADSDATATTDSGTDALLNMAPRVVRTVRQLADDSDCLNGVPLTDTKAELDTTDTEVNHASKNATQDGELYQPTQAQYRSICQAGLLHTDQVASVLPGRNSKPDSRPSATPPT